MAIVLGREQKPIFSAPASKQQRQKKLIYLAVVTVAITAVLYFVYLKKPDLISVSPILPTPGAAGELNSRTAELIRSLSLSFPVLEDNRFKSLVLPGNLPIVPGQAGRLDPFEPF